jgi:hypothetical protein
MDTDIKKTKNKPLIVEIDPEIIKKLKLIAVERNSTLKKLMLEAITIVYGI